MSRNTFWRILQNLHLCDNLINKTNSRSFFQWLISQIGDFWSSLSTGTTNPSYDSLLKNSCRFKRNIKSNSYLVRYRPYQDTNKEKQGASSTKWKSGHNVVLQLMECLTSTVNFDLFMVTIPHLFSFCLLTHLKVNNIRAKGVFNKNRLCKYTIIGDKQLQKNQRGYFKERIPRQADMLCNFYGWLEWHQGAST